jgi:NADH/NAD ratio-sensing transcriptional regulator Rex
MRQQIAEVLVKGGVKAIWNFAPIDVEVEDACIENVHLSDSLFVLSYAPDELLTKTSFQKPRGFLPRGFSSYK